MTCPDDGETLIHDTASPRPYARCPRCHGMWFTRDAWADPYAGDATLLPRNRRPTIPAPPRSGSRRCPACAKPMRERRVDAAIIDECDTCRGTWLDAGEYDMVRVQLQAQVPPPRAPSSDRLHVGFALVAEALCWLAWFT